MVPLCRRVCLSFAPLFSLVATAVAQPQQGAISTWPSTAHYLAFAELPSAQDGTIRITAGGRYTLYLNGDLVGSDDDPETVETWDVGFSNRSNNVAVVVEHAGDDSPYGLFAVLQSEDVLFVSSPLDRTTPWFWTGTPLPNEAGADWTELRLNRLDRHEEDGEAVLWEPVQAGSLSPDAYTDFADLDLTRASSVAGFPGGLDGSGNGLQLRSLKGVNTAFGSLSQDPNLIDGDISTAVSFRRGASSLLQGVETDLGRLITIDAVRVVTQPPSSSGSFADNSLRGYSILVSKDGVSFIEVAARNQIEDFRETSVNFTPISARHVLLRVTEFSARDASPRVGEMEVFGAGVVPTGSFRSPPLDLGTVADKNFDQVRWSGEIPEDAEISLRFRSGDGETWSEWSAWRSDRTIDLDVPEPRALLQFETRMATRDQGAGPRLDSLTVTFDDGNMPVARAAASIVPGQVEIGVVTDFVYTLEVETDAASAGVARIVLLTPYPATFDIASIGGATPDAASTYATNDSLVIGFDPPLKESVQLTIPFQTRMLSASHDFRGLLYSPGSSNALRTTLRDGTDPEGLPLTTRVESVTFDISILSEVVAKPGVFTPNGDGRNDVGVIGFVLGRVVEAPVRIEIYEVGGRLRRTLAEQILGSGSYRSLGAPGAGLPGAWDGLDDAGDLVAPGIYLYRVVADLEPTDAVSVGVIGVAY